MMSDEKRKDGWGPERVELPPEEIEAKRAEPLAEADHATRAEPDLSLRLTEFWLVDSRLRSPLPQKTTTTIPRICGSAVDKPVGSRLHGGQFRILRAHRSTMQQQRYLSVASWSGIH